MITLLKKTSTTLLLFAMLLGGCKKTETTNSGNDLNALRQHVKSKLTAQEYGNINWGSVKKAAIANNEAVYTFRYTNDTHALLTVSTNKGEYAAQTFKYSVTNQVVSTSLTNLESGKVKQQNKTMGEILQGGGRPPIVPNTGGPTLPEVILVAYINNNIPNLSTPHATDLMMFISVSGSFNYQQELASLDPNSSNYGQSPILGPVLEFESIDDVLDFLQWLEGLNSYELVLLAQNPWVAPFLRANTASALAKATEWAATEFPNDPAKQAASLNGGKADALRHAYWVALNRSDIGETLAQLFADAHEYGATKPASMPQATWDLNRQMDLNNNTVGIAFGYGFNVFSTASTIWAALVAKSTETGSPVYTGLKYICNGVLIHFYETCP